MGERNDAAVAKAAARRPWREADVRVLLAAWRQSGQTLTAFARRYEVHPERLGRWHRLLRAAAPPAVQFHPVRVQQGRPLTAADGARIELVWRDGTVIRVPPGFGAGDLRRVLAVVDGGAAC